MRTGLSFSLIWASLAGHAGFLPAGPRPETALTSMPDPKRKFEKIAFVATEAPEAQEALGRLIQRYGNAEPKRADVIVALGGDGLMLQTLHRHMSDRIP